MKNSNQIASQEEILEKVEDTKEIKISNQENNIKILDQIKETSDIKKLTDKQKEQLAQEIREEIIDTRKFDTFLIKKFC